MNLSFECIKTFNFFLNSVVIWNQVFIIVDIVANVRIEVFFEQQRWIIWTFYQRNEKLYYSAGKNRQLYHENNLGRFFLLSILFDCLLLGYPNDRRWYFFFQTELSNKLTDNQTELITKRNIQDYFLDLAADSCLLNNTVFLFYKKFKWFIVAAKKTSILTFATIFTLLKTWLLLSIFNCVCNAFKFQLTCYTIFSFPDSCQ